jgi:plasmid stabilization system protein ParE
MNATFLLTPQATEDLDAIWWFIAADSREAAGRVEMEIVATCRRLAKHPLMGTKRRDITPLPLRFWTVTRFPNLCDRLPPRNGPVASGRRAARKARPERGSGQKDLIYSRETALRRIAPCRRAVSLPYWTA